jgi:hypothetical protein
MKLKQTALVAIMVFMGGAATLGVKDTTDVIEIERAFFEFMSRHGKIYRSMEETVRRRDIFRANYERVVSHNAEDRGYKLGLNKYSDLTHEEFLELYAPIIVPTKPNRTDETQPSGT